MQRISSIPKALENQLGFWYGCAELTLKNPPPLVPRSLIASWEQHGPRAIVCVPPASVWTWAAPASVCGTPVRTSTSAATIDSGSST